MRIESDGYFVSFFIEQEKKKYFSKEFFLNKKSLGIENRLEKWVYIYELPTFLTKGTVYFGKPCPADFFSENQSDLLKFLGLKQSELGILPIETKGIVRIFGTSLSKVILKGEALPQIGDIVGAYSLSEYVFEYNYILKNWSGNFSKERKILLPMDSSVKKATNSPIGVVVDGLTTGISNLTGQSTVSEGVVIIDKDKSVYLPNNIEDLKGIIGELRELIILVGGISPTACPTCSAESIRLLSELLILEQNLK